MKSSTIFRVIALLFVASIAFAQTPYKELKYPPIHEIKLPKIQRTVLPNGMIVYLVEDHDQPLVTARARIGAGSIDDPAEKIGLAELVGTVMRTGGTPTRSGDQIDEQLESIAASVETSIDLASGFATMSTLKENTDTGLEVLADILMNPAFPQDKLDLAKVEMRSLIARRNDEVGDIAEREFEKLIYGGQSVYARTPEYATVDAIKREDLIAFHKKYFYPNNVMLGVWGDFNSKEMLAKIQTVFKGWKKGESRKPQPPPVDYKFDYSVNFIKKEDVNQSNIFIGHIGGLLNNPDYFALQVMNNVLSGGFGSRLFTRVRSNQGLAYSVFGRYSANFTYPGEFYAGAETKAESTVKTIRAILHEVEELKKEPVSDDELARAKDSFLNSYVFNFDTNGEIVTRLMTYEYYGYPADFLQKTKANIEKVTKEDVLRVAQKYLQPDKVRILVVGPEKGLDEPLSALGKVNEIDITIPVPKQEAPKADAGSISKGKDLLKKAVDAAGGSAAFQAVQAVSRKGKLTVNTPQGSMDLDMDVTIVPPDRMRVNLNTPMGAMTQILKQDEAWVVSPNGSSAAPDQMKADLKSSLWRDLTVLLSHADSDQLQIQYVGSEDVAGKKAEVIQITPQGASSYKLYLDAETMMPVKNVFDTIGQQGPAKMEQMYSDFRDVSGLKLPFHIVVNQNGEKAQETVVSEITINPKVDDSIFTPGK